MKIETTGENRKAMVQAIGTFMGKDVHYMGPPTFNYTVGQLVIDRDGVITCEDDSSEEKLKRFLSENGYFEIPSEELNIQVPIDTSNVATLRNILAMLHARAYLLNRVTRRETFKIGDAVLEAVEALPADSTFEDFKTALEADNGAVAGISFEAETVTFIFPLSENRLKNRAYAELSAMMVARAKEAKRVSSEPVIQENEKYYLRIWLVQLGLSGKGGKESRKALLDGLKGHTAFRTPEEAERFSTAQKEKRAAVKAARMAISEEDSEA